MKNLKAIATGALLAICCLHCGAQEKKIPINEPDYHKPRLFSDLPQRMNLDLASTESVLSSKTGASVSIRLSDKFVFEGIVVSRSSEDDRSVMSVVIRSTNRAGTIFTFTRTTNTDGTFKYRGRILGKNNGDAYEIVNDRGLYVLEKRNLYDLISE
jgi:hypothetical protein